MPDRRSPPSVRTSVRTPSVRPSSLRLLLRRSRERGPLLASAAATVAIAVATVCLVLAWLTRAAAVAGDPPPPGLDADDIAEQAALGTAALASAAPALVLLVAILAATAVAQLARLVAAAREHETTTIRARGFSRAQGWVTDAAEGVAVALAGAVLGVAVAVAPAAVVGATAGDVLAAWPWAAAMALVLAAVFAIALRRGESQRTTTRVTRATTAALVVVVVLAAALVIWQLPLARAGGFDPIVAVAPAVVLLAGALVALAAFGVVAVAWARPASRGVDIEPGYSARQVARRLPIYAVAVLLVALTVAQAVFASAYSSTWTAMTTDSAAVRTGADLRVDTSPQAVAPDDVAVAAGVSGIDAVAPALVDIVEVGATRAQLVAVPGSAITPVVTDAGGLIDRVALASTAEAPGTVVAEPVALGDAASGIRITADLSGEEQYPTVMLSAVVLDATGAPAPLPLEGGFTDNGDGTVTVTGEAALPEGMAPWRLLAIAASTGRRAGNATVTLRTVEAIGGGTLDVSGETYLSGGSRDALVWLADGGVLAGGGELPPVALALTSALAARLGLAVGDPLEFRYDGTGRRGAGVVSTITDAVPGARTGHAAFAPLEILLVSQLQRGTSIVQPNAVWAAGAASADDELSAALGDRPVATAAPGIAASVVGALAPGWWIATAGAALLSLVAAFAIVQTLGHARRRELGVLRALGVTPARQARIRAGELGGVLSAGLVLGAAAGGLVAWSIVPALVRAVTPGILPLAGGVAFAWAPLGVAVALLVVGLAVVVALAAADVARTARGATVGEDAR